MVWFGHCEMLGTEVKLGGREDLSELGLERKEPQET